jgi:hypothetical protein
MMEEIIFIGLLTFLAYWKKETLLYVIAGFGLVLFGVHWIGATEFLMGILAIVTGATTFLVMLRRR